MTAKSTGDSEGSGNERTVRVGVIDSRHLLLVGAGPGLGLAVAQLCFRRVSSDFGRSEHRPVGRTREQLG
jgi:hypothetical protein